MNKKVVAYITAYQDIESTQKCLNSLQDQSYPLNNILIIDNSYKQLELTIRSPHLIKHYPEKVRLKIKNILDF